LIIGQLNLRARAGSHLRNGLEAFALSPGTRVHPAAAICHWLCNSRTRILFRCQGNVREATHPDGAGCSGRKIDHPSAYKRSPVVDGHHNGLAVSPTRDADSRATRQRPMSCSACVLVERAPARDLSPTCSAISAREPFLGTRRTHESGDQRCNPNYNP
jgi:hypothetical protein